jgi:hypothetical protein
MSDIPETTEEHLRGASDAILILTAQVRELERHKRGVPPDDPRFEELAGAVRDAAVGLAEFADQESEWAARAQGDAIELPIDASTPPPTLGPILERWRAIERQLRDTDPGTEEAKRLFAAFEQVREEYMAAFAARRETD